MVYHNGDRPVNLFKQHDTGQPMGPGHFAQREKLSGVFAGFGAVAVGAADQECKVLGALVEVALQEFGKTLAGHGFSALVEHKGKGLWSQRTGKQLCLFSLALIGSLGLGLGKIGYCQLCNSGLAAKTLKAGLIFCREGLFRPGLQLSDAHDLKAHGLFGLGFLGRMLRPQFFQIIETANLGPEEMDDNINGVHQHPIALVHAFNADMAMTCFLEFFD